MSNSWLKRAALAHLALLILGALFFWYTKTDVGLFGPFVGGWLLSFANLCLLVLAVRKFFQKQFALALPISVIKYAILGMIVYLATKVSGAELLWLCGGVGTGLVSLLIPALTFVKARQT